MNALDLVTLTVAGTGAAQQPCLPVSGDSLTIRQFPPAYRARLIGVHIISQTEDRFRVLSPRLHDNINGITFQASAVTSGYNLMTSHVKQYLESTDLLRVIMLASIASNVVLLIPFYEHITDVKTSLITATELDARSYQMRQLPYKTVGITVTGYSNRQSLSDGLFKITKEYALLGFHGGGTQAFMRVRSEETGKLSVGFPPFSFTGENLNYFPCLSKQYNNLRCIPVFRGINISTAVVEAIGFTEIYGDLYFMELT